MLKKIRVNFDILLEFVVVTLFVISLLPKNVANKEISNIENSKLDTNFSYNYETVGDNEESKEEVKEEKEDIAVAEVKETVVVPEPAKEEEVITPKEEVKKEETISTPLPNYTVIDTYYGRLTGYGPDCRGCSGRTATSYDVSNTITYYDEEFGEVRILAADRSIPFYSIIRISGVFGEPVIGIVLDRGGNVGFNKFSTFDLLFPTESAAAKEIGTISDVKFELIRKGA